MSGGGPCPEAVMEPYRERDITFVQGYGLTEGGPNNLYLSPDRDDTEAKSDRVGRPFPDCEARIVDGDGTPVDGVGTGELELAGPVTADGYLDTEDGTFDGRWVSTGDVAHRDADGDYAIVGRTDNMFVSGGENVYPEDVEDTLSTHPDVADVGVTPVPHEKWGQVPCAVVVGSVSESELDAYAREHLADFEVPREYAFVDALPETGAGKLDRDALASEYGR
jgi:fatty-acyl-CoA synthase